MNSKIENFSQVAGVFRWKPAAWLVLSGSDAFSFVQGQFSNDLRPVIQGNPVYGLWLDRKGKVLADSFVGTGQGAGEFWIGSYHSTADTIRQRLEDFIVADDVVVGDETSRWEGVTVSDAIENSPLTEMLQRFGAISFPARRGFPAREWILSTEQMHDPTLDALLRNGRQFSEIEMEEFRIKACIPAVPRDIGPVDLPQEGELESDAVSFSKGCYLGQEVMARLNTMGKVRRRLFRVRSNAAVPALPAALFQDGKRIGELRTAVSRAGELTGLALLSTVNLLPGSPLRLVESGTSEREFFIETP